MPVKNIFTNREPEWAFVPFVKDAGILSRFVAFTPEEFGVFAHLAVYQTQHGSLPANLLNVMAILPRNYSDNPTALEDVLVEFFPIVGTTERRENPDITRLLAKRRTRKEAVRKAFADGIVNPKLRFQILERDGFRCRYCGASGRQEELDVDHIHPRSDGGADEPDNLITACIRCNTGKGDRVLRTHPPVAQ